MQTCSQCNNVLEDGVKFCDKCGAAVQQAAPAPAAEPIVEPAEKTAEKKDIVDEIQKQIPVKLSKNALIGILAGAVVVLVILAVLIFGGGSPNYILYTSDGHTFYAEGSSYKPQQLGDELKLVEVNEDADKYLMKDEDGDLYYYELGDDEALKLDSEAYNIFVNEDFDLVTYLKGDVIYQHDLKEKEKLASDVDSIVAVSLNGKIIYYYEEAQVSESDDDDDYKEPARTLYVKNGSKEAEKIGEGISVAAVTEDLETIYYKDDDSLFRKKLGKEKEKLASDVLELYGVTVDGTAYYAKGTENEDSDDTDVTFCYFDGKKEIALGEEMTLAYYGGIMAPERDVAVFRGMEPDEEDAVYWVAVEDTITEIQEDLDSLAAIDEEGKTLYYFVDVNDENEGDLYCIEIGSKPGKAEKIDSEVSTYDVSILGEDVLVYFKDVKDSHGEMFVDGKSADVDVYLDSLMYHEDEDLILYFTDYNEEKSQGTLRIFDGKAESIMDDVYRAYFTPDGDVAFLVDYNLEKSRGELYIWKGGKPKKLADDVNRIYNTYSYAKAFEER